MASTVVGRESPNPCLFTSAFLSPAQSDVDHVMAALMEGPNRTWEFALRPKKRKETPTNVEFASRLASRPFNRNKGVSSTCD